LLLTGIINGIMK